MGATDGLEGALPARAGATARPPGLLCCSLVGNGFDGVSLGERDILLPSAKSWPEKESWEFSIWSLIVSYRIWYQPVLASRPMILSLIETCKPCRNKDWMEAVPTYLHKQRKARELTIWGWPT